MENINTRYRSCEAIEQGIAFMHNYIVPCCNCSHPGGGFDMEPFYIYPKNKSIKLDWKMYFKLKDKVRIQNMQDSEYPACKGCLYLNNQEWNNDNQKLSYFNFNHWKDCDTNCIYCGVKKNPEIEKIPRIYKILTELDKKRLIEKNGMIMFGGGDIAFLDEFNKIAELFIKYNYSFNIATSAVHYVPMLAKLLEKGMAEVRISPDTANELTYKRIKRTDYYKTVWENMAKYAKIQKNQYCVRSKFILIPNVNDTKEEIDLWLSKTAEIGIKSVLLDIESNYYINHRCNIPEYIFELFIYTKEKAEELGLYFLVFDHASQMLEENNKLLSEYYFTQDITQQKIRESMQHNKKISIKNKILRIFNR